MFIYFSYTNKNILHLNNIAAFILTKTKSSKVKKILTSLLLLFMHGANAQQNMISSITISMPPTVPANTNDWATALPPVSITAQAKLDSSRGLSPDVQESRILVTIKNNGSIICGEYTPTTSPMAGFNSIVRNWRGGDIEKLIGTRACVLKPGQYTLCVQFFNYEGKQLSEERCKPFTIIGDVATGDEKYTPPQAIMPADGKVFTEKEIKTSLSFRWTPVVPKPQGKVFYTIKIIEISEGQTGASALKISVPLMEKEVTDITQLSGINFNLGSYKIQKNSRFGWYVEAVDANNKMYGRSEVNTFGIISTTTSCACANWPATLAYEFDNDYVNMPRTTGNVSSNGVIISANNGFLHFPNIVSPCSNTSCADTVFYSLYHPDNTPILEDMDYLNSGILVEMPCSAIGNYKIKIYSKCGATVCSPFIVYVSKPCPPPPPPCNPNCSFTGKIWGDGFASSGSTFNCGEIVNLKCNTSYQGGVSLTCTSPASSTLINNGVVRNNTGQVLAGINSYNYNFTLPGNYTVTYFKSNAAGQVCDSCVIYFNVTCPSFNCNCLNVNQGLGCVSNHVVLLDTIVNNCNKSIASWNVTINGGATISGVISPQSIAAGTTIINPIVLTNIIPGTRVLTYTFNFADGTQCIINKNILLVDNCLPACPATPCTTTVTLQFGSAAPVTLSTTTPTTLNCNQSYSISRILNCTPANTSINFNNFGVLDFTLNPANVVTWAAGFTGSGVLNIPANVSGTFYLRYRWGTATDNCGFATYQLNITCTPSCTPPPNPPIATNVSYCQNATATALTATGVNLKWYTTASGGIGSGTVVIPSTATVGTTSYWVSQTANGCESNLTQVNVIVNPIPSVPIVSPVTYCRNAIASPLSVTGITGAAGWYTAATGGFASPNAPVPSTTTLGTTTYWVAQILNGCVSQRVPIVVTVNNCVTCVCTSNDTAQYTVNGIANYVKCNNTINVSSTDVISYIGKTFSCGADTSCRSKGEATLYAPDGTIINTNNNSASFSWPSTGTVDPFTLCNGVYKAVFKGYCGNISCDSCTVFINVQCPCVCTTNDSASYTVNGITNAIRCRDTIAIFQTDILSSVTKQFTCSDPSRCALSGNAYLYNSAGSLIQQSPISGFNWNAGFPAAATSCDAVYRLVIKGNCGTTNCDSCTIYIKIKCPQPACNCGIWRETVYRNLRTGADLVTPPNSTITLPLNSAYSFQTSFGCNPQTGSCRPTNIKDSVYYIGANNVPVLQQAGTSLSVSIKINQCGRYKIVFTATCGTAVCRNTLDILVDCCGGRKIKMFNNTTDITSSANCVQAGNYTFNLDPALPAGTPVYWKLTTFPNNSSTTGMYSFSTSGQTLTIPANTCDITSFQLIYRWNNEWCSDTLQKNICATPCCDYIVAAPTQTQMQTKLLSGLASNRSMDFLSIFNLPAGFSTVNISKIKIQILRISVNNQVRPNANLASSQIISPAVTSTLVNNNAIITGDAVWFNSIPTLSGPTALVFRNRVINLQTVPGGPNIVQLRLRYTFYRNNGSCSSTICEKEINY